MLELCDARFAGSVRVWNENEKRFILRIVGKCLIVYSVLEGFLFFLRFRSSIIIYYNVRSSSFAITAANLALYIVQYNTIRIYSIRSSIIRTLSAIQSSQLADSEKKSFAIILCILYYTVNSFSRPLSLKTLHNISVIYLWMPSSCALKNHIYLFVHRKRNYAL